ncbi:ATP-binding domain-containing protein [Mesorhizobium sp. AR02]|uniref:ATP-binding domain-containing protein n=1 Tax=Mesorhizobium sp. AR02 TaxID=2865837 RepID=UPI00216103E6|nr:ATP-dependent helicase [Mesorhizobium sp. AR02]UVK50385.1 ATP-binding domain-containing protein [Mesorhizobium sp. AR02]
MTVRAVEGAAGCGKTFRLMEMLAETLAAHPLTKGQRVLALTFMHGARRRLADRLRTVPGLVGRVECCTVDSFAWRISRRWRGLAAALGVPARTEGEFDAVCDAAGMLLEQVQVRNWTAASFPIVLVDEGQDLRPQRMRMLVALSTATRTLIAADEFQCLDQSLRPNPLVAWMQGAAEPETLVQVRRTNMGGLLAAAAAIRGGQAPINGQGFRILQPGVSVPLAATLLANAVAWRQGGNVAVITPALQGGFTQNVVARVGQGPCGQQGSGPYSIHWEGTDREETQVIIDDLQLGATSPAMVALAALRALPPSGPVRASIMWVENQIHALGRVEFARADIEAVIARNVALRRQHGGNFAHLFTALTVQQAKNREFDGVVIVWPYQVGGDVEHKRRLLYNAVTRAKQWCNVIVQGQNILAAAPFV